MSTVALVTGAARGIGAATVARLSRDGWAVVAVDRCADDPAVPYPLASEDDLRAVVEACEGSEPVVPVVADVRDRAALDAAVALAVRDLGGLDAAVAAAGVIVGGPPAWEASDEQYDAILDINLRGVWMLARAAIPALLGRPEPRQGRFVAVVSAAAHRGMPQLALYGAAKAGVAGLIPALAADLRGTGVTANGVSPGSTTTSMLEASAEIYGLAETGGFVDHHILQRLLEPDEIAAAVGWLCSTESSAVTGTVMRVDGGLTA
jgi:SDR family mycofactocin-dependent oxidoreductase